MTSLARQMPRDRFGASPGIPEDEGSCVGDKIISQGLVILGVMRELASEFHPGRPM